jgi:hypothetical protein
VVKRALLPVTAESPAAPWASHRGSPSGGRRPAR